MPGRSPFTVITRFDPGLAGMRQAAVTMAAALASFGTALVIEHFARLSTGIVTLAVVLALSIGRRGQRAEHRTLAGRLSAIVVLPLVAVAANEIGARIFQQPDLGDTLFVLAISTTIWVRRFGPVARQVATFATFPLVAMLIGSAPTVNAAGPGDDGRWWSALVALIALAWVTVAQLAAGRSGVLVSDGNAPERQLPQQRAADRKPTPGAAGGARTGPRIGASTKMALQMAASLGAAFAVGRSLFGVHWTWTVLTAFIVCSGNRGRGDVVYKAALRLLGAAVGTLAATALSGAYPPGDRWSVVVIFAVLSVALWLRSVNYAFWAGGITAALALLYGYYGERGISLLGTRLEAIVIGAAVAVAASWLLLPVLTSDVLRRDTATALKALDDYLAGLYAAPSKEPAPPPVAQARFHEAVAILKTTATPLRLLPAALRSCPGHLPATVQALDQCAAALPAVTAARWSRSVGGPREPVDAVRATVGELRLVNARKLAAGPGAWQRLADAVRGLPAMLDAPTQAPAPSSPEPISVRAEGPSQVDGTRPVEMASGRTPSGYPGRLAAPTEPAHRDHE